MKHIANRGLLIGLTLLVCSSLHSQVTFQKTFGSNLAEEGTWVANTSTGYIIAGLVNGPNTGRDGYLLNLDFDGNQIWQKRYIGGNGQDVFNVVYETDGGFMVLGEIENSAGGATDVWLLKISQAGNILWSKTIGDANYRELGYAMIPVSGDRILISGAKTPTGFTGFNSCFYLVDNTGALIWSRYYESGSTGNLIRSTYVDNGIIYACGGAEAEGALLRLDLETGDIIDARTFAGSGFEALYYQVPAPDGNIVLSDGTRSASANDAQKLWVNKITPQGQTLWSKVYSRSSSELRGRIELAGDGNFLLTPYDGGFTQNGDAMLAKIDEGGNLMWSRNYGQAGLDWLWKSQLAPDGGFISVGTRQDETGNRDILVIKTDYDGLIDGCCIPKANIIAANYNHQDQDFTFTSTPWSSPAPVTNQQVNTGLQERSYCANLPVEIIDEIQLCPEGVFSFQGVDYHAPDEVIEVLQGLFGCDTIVHHNLILLPQITQSETIVFCAGTAVTLHGQNFYEEDTVIINLSPINGCDTVLTYYLVYDTVALNCLSCEGTFLKIVGEGTPEFQGHGVYDAGDGNLYITGTKQDSALLIKMTPTGYILWSRTFDILPGEVDNITELILDSEGMLAACGQGGDVQPVAAGFVFRYDPLNNIMLWTQTITNGSPFVLGIMEKSPGGNYILNSNPHLPADNVQLTELSRADGTVVQSPLTKMLDTGNEDSFNSALISNGKMYSVGRLTQGNSLTDMRHSLSRININTGIVERTYIGPSFLGSAARFYGMDLLIEGNDLISVGYGNEHGDDLNDSKIFIYSGDININSIGGPTRIDLLATTSEAVDEIVEVPDGHIILCHSLFDTQKDIFLIKINKIGSIVWSKRIDFGVDQLSGSGLQSQILAKDGFLFCVATTTNATGEKRMMVLKITQDGKMDGDCDYVSDTPATAELIGFSTGQALDFNESPVNDTLVSSAVLVTKIKAASQYFCRERVEDQVNISLCQGESITLEGQVYTETDTVSITFNNANGCDTTIVYFIEVLPRPVRSESISFCAGESVVIGGQTYSAAGTVIDTIPGTAGCDTIVTYTLTVLPQPTRSESIALCPGESIVISGQTYSAAGTVIDTIPGTAACDTIVTYTLTVLPQPTRSESIVLCPGESITIGGQVYTQSGTVLDTVPAAVGCDTLVTYTLSLLPQPSRSETIEFCPGESITIGGQTYTQPGIVLDTIPGISGCDTIVTYTLQSTLPAPSVVAIQCPLNVSLIAEPGTAPLLATYNLPTATSDCPCPGISLNLTAGQLSGSLFPNGITTVCYRAQDSCGHSASCCFTVTIREIQPCDVKVNGCMQYELLSITADPDQNRTYRIRVINNCANKLIYTAIQLPAGVTALAPANLSTFTSENGLEYEVRNPNFSPFYSIRFKSTSDSIFGGQSDIFEYTLPAQSVPVYMDITSRLAPQVFYEAHLNTFYCPVGMTTNKDRNALQPMKGLSQVQLFPNPTTGILWVDLGESSKKAVKWQVFNSQGQEVITGITSEEEELLEITLPQNLSNGLFFYELLSVDGEREVQRFILQR